MNSFLCLLNLVYRNCLAPLMLLIIVSLLVQNQAVASDDKANILAIANWAQINFPDSFFNQFNSPLSDSGYKYVCFEPSNNCIGITERSGPFDPPSNVDVLIDGKITRVDSLENILAWMADSQNGILNMSGALVGRGGVPSVFSPGLGKIDRTDNIIDGITWLIATSSDSGQGTSCELKVTNHKNPTEVSHLKFTFLLTNSSSVLTKSSTGDHGIEGVLIDYQSRALTFTEDVIFARHDSPPSVIIASGSTLRF